MNYRMLAGALLAVSVAVAQGSAEPAGDAKRGRVLFESVGCYACHGLQGQGAQMTGPRLARIPLPFAGFIRILRRPLSQMPPYEAAVLSDQEGADIYAYLQQLPGPRDPNTIALLKLQQ